jgi:branched-chain amino acid transport system ATP-binding protein
MSFIRIAGLHAGYGKSLILRNIELEVDEGEAVAVVGKNGAGKSTLLMSFFGGTTIRSGSIEVGGVALQHRPGYLAAKQGVSASPQGRLILPHLSVRENLLLGAASGRKGHWTLDKVYALFPVLQERHDRMGTALSGGQQQMLAVGRALMANPSLILLDEPTEGLAPVIVDQLGVIFNQVAAQGTALLLIEQNMTLVARVAERFCAMAKGSVVAEGRVREDSLAELHRHVMV